MDQITSAADPRHRTSRTRRVGLAAAVGIGLALGAAGIAGAADDATSSPSPGSSSKVAPHHAPPAFDGRHPGRGHGPGGPGGPGGGKHGIGPAGAALHGEFVVPDGSGGYRTVRTQRGVVTAVSATSLTVKSDDGYTSTYVLHPSTVVVAGRDGIGTVEKGETVAVHATVKGGTATAEHVRDLTRLKELRKDHAPDRVPDDPAPGGTPASPSSYDRDAQGA